MINKNSIFLIACVLFNIGCRSKPTLLKRLSAEETGIHFKNTLQEDDKYNVLEYMNLYTGAGVAAGDFNKDGLTDLFFAGNQTTGRLYLNKGHLKFEDITDKAGLKSDRWQTGVSIVDINQDGWLDIYVNVAGSKNYGSLANLLYINNGNNTFTEKAAEYGIADERLTMQSVFFDYDKDGDLDLFLITNPADEMVSGVNVVKERQVKGESAGTDILYRNNGNGTFTDVSRQAGILIEGYSLGVSVSDFNGDGLPDIFVSNDFLSNDILYINNGNGTFTDKINDYLKHSSFASMGNDAADFNNDGLIDLFVLDMLPEDNYRRKMIIPPTSYDKFELLLQKKYTPAYTRNTLQLNTGNGFSEMGYLAGVSSTDWSWTGLFGDYDNDGDKDLMVTNGFYRDLGNLDYISYQAKLHHPMGRQDAKQQEKLKAIEQLARVPLQNYVFENKGDLTFQKRSDEWGLFEKGFSNGAIYADLDNDGDLEFVLNDLNDVAKVYENQSNTLLKNHYIKIQLNGKTPNRNGIGAKIWLYADSGRLQFQEFQPTRGYESSVAQELHFGLGKVTKIDSLVIEWSNGNRQIETQLKIDTLLKINYLESSKSAFATRKDSFLFKELTDKRFVDYSHRENNYNDFKIQPLLPHQYSRSGPSMTKGDVNGDGLEDFYISASLGTSGTLFLQNAAGFEQKAFPNLASADETSCLLFDADGDKDLDLYLVHGGSEFAENAPEYQDELYENDGNGHFKPLKTALPDTRASGSTVVTCDFDHDGDLDLFIGGRVVAGRYPIAPRSYLLRNDSKPQQLQFTDITPSNLQNMGMVTSAIWARTDADAWEDLVLVGEYMPLTIFRNQQGQFTKSEKAQTTGWWSSVTAADFDKDGDMDLMVGNLGLNTRYRASVTAPLTVYAKDFDKNGRIDPILCGYNQGKNYMVCTRDELIKQIPAMRSRFGRYEDFAKETVENSFTAAELKDALFLKAECLTSMYFENDGNGRFEPHILPIAAQFAPINSILAGDFDQDGHLDALIAGNAYETEPTMGRYDASLGLLLKGDGKGHFKSILAQQTGFRADKDAKSMLKIQLKDPKNQLIIVGNNADKIQTFLYIDKK